MRLLVGLGNPGQRYMGTRHNVGAAAIEAFRAAQGDTFGPWRDDAAFNARVSEGRIDDEKVVLLLPQTYMNLSGDAVAQAVAFWKLAPEDVLVVLDDLALPVGRIRIRREGSAGGQNGLKHVIARLGTDAVPRLRIGVGSARTEGVPAEESVLQRFAPDEREAAEVGVQTAIEALAACVERGLEAAMNEYNRGDVEEETK